MGSIPFNIANTVTHVVEMDLTFTIGLAMFDGEDGEEHGKPCIVLSKWVEGLDEVRG